MADGRTQASHRTDTPARRTGRVLPSLSAALLVTSLLLPVWQVTLYAPQYPGGLRASVYLTRVAGDAAEISTLNHYIGLPPLEGLAALERRLALPLVAAMAAAVAISATWRGAVRVLLQVPAILFPVGVAADLTLWLWRMGHAVDPHAPIRIEPFMPPLVGRGQVMQFATHATFGPGFAAAVAAAALLLVDMALRRRNRTASQPSLPPAARRPSWQEAR